MLERGMLRGVRVQLGKPGVQATIDELARVGS